MSWITKTSKRYWYGATFQKIIWKIKCECDLPTNWIYRLLGLHAKVYYKLLSGDIELDYYFKICWQITDKINEYNKTMYNRAECKSKIGNIYGFLTNRRKEVGLYYDKH